MFHALAYVPEADVIAVAEQVVYKHYEDKVDPKTGDPEWLEMTTELARFHEYSQHWTGKPKFNIVKGKSGRRPPTYPVQIWNLHEQLKESTGISSNNKLEAYNKTLNGQLGLSPNLWKAIEFLVGQETETRRIILANSRGDDMTNNSGRLAKVIAKRNQLRSVLNRYNNLSADLYIRQMAHILASREYK